MNLNKFYIEHPKSFQPICDGRKEQLEKSLAVWQERLNADPNNKTFQKQVDLRKQQLAELGGSAPAQAPASSTKPSAKPSGGRVIPKISNANDLYNYADQLGLDTTVNGKRMGADAIKAMIGEKLWNEDHPGEEMPPQISPMLIKDITQEGKDYVDKTFTKKDWILQCFNKSARVRMADGSVKKIADIKVGEEVWGWTEEGFVSTPVISTYQSPDRQKLYTVKSPYGKYLATADHRWWVKDKWVFTKDLSSVSRVVPVGVSKQLLYGTMMGDAMVDTFGCLQFTQSFNHSEYVDWMARVVGMTSANVQIHDAVCQGKRFPYYKRQSVANQYFWLRDKFYIDGVKVVPTDLSDVLSPAFFAAWFTDDGSLTTAASGPHPGARPNARLYFNQFKVEQIQTCLDYLTEQGFKFKILEYPKSKGHSLKMVSFDVESTQAFSEWIAPYVPACMGYKITCEPKGDDLVAQYGEEIVDVSVIPTNRAKEQVFCIGTATDNFVLAGGEMVHNCKINGQRFIMCLNPDGSTHMTSRDRSVKTFRYSELDDHVLGLLNLKSPFEHRTILDGEIICDEPEIDLPSGVHTTSTLQSTVALMHMNSKDSLEFQRKNGFSLRYKVFDIIMLDGKSVEQEPYDVRKELTVTACQSIIDLNPDCAIDILPTIEDYESAWDEFEKYVGEGGEGLIVKNRHWPYEQGKRTKGQFKLKGFIGIDAFVTGFVHASDDKSLSNYIGGLVFSTNYHGKQIEIAAVSNLDLYTRKAATSYDDSGNPILNPEWLGKCAELKGQNLKAGSFRMGSARINEWRDDKNPEDCELQDSQIVFDS